MMSRSYDKKKMIGAVIMAVWVAVSGAQAEPPKIATVDVQRLFREYHRTVKAQQHYNAEYAKIQKRVNERSQVASKVRLMLRDLGTKINKGEIPEEELETKKQEASMIQMELEMMQRNIENFSNTEKKRVANLKASSMHGIMKEIREKIAAHAEKQGFDFVFDKSGKNSNQVTFFVYLRDAQDITSAMLMELNKFAPEESGK